MSYNQSEFRDIYALYSKIIKKFEEIIEHCSYHSIDDPVQIAYFRREITNNQGDGLKDLIYELRGKINLFNLHNNIIRGSRSDIMIKNWYRNFNWALIQNYVLLKESCSNINIRGLLYDSIRDIGHILVGPAQFGYMVNAYLREKRAEAQRNSFGYGYGYDDDYY